MAFLILCFSEASGGEGKGGGKGNVISSELQCFAFSNPIQVVTVAKRKTGQYIGCRKTLIITPMKVHWQN